MSLALLSPARTVLHVSDEALYVYSVSSKDVKLIDSVPWTADGFIQKVVNIIVSKCGKKPILILNDMVEQHYRKEKVVNAKGGFLDKSGIVNRKLKSAFPNYPVKAAFKLKEKVVKAPGQLPSDIYIFAAVPDSDQFRQAIAASTKSLASLSGFCLLPIEASDMIRTLSEKLSKYKKDVPKWSILIGQHKNGSLRQVVTKNGELALTRMTPIVDNDNDPERWASEVYQEFQATMSYLARFDYNSDDKLHLNVIANADAGALLKSKIGDSKDIIVHVMGASEAARLLNITIGPQEDERYADILHVAWVGRKNKFILPMKATEVDEVSRPRQIAMMASIVMVLGAAFLTYQLFSSIQKVSSLSSDIKSTENRKSQLDVQYQKEIKKKEDLGFDVRLVQSSMDVYTALQADKIEPIKLFRSIGKALGKDLHLSDLSIERYNPNRPGGVVARFLNNQAGGEQKPDPLFETTLSLTYPSTTNIQEGNREVAALGDRLTQALPDYDVEVTKLLKDYEYTEGLVIEAGRRQGRDLTQDFVAEIVVRGPFEEVQEPQQ